LNKPNEEMGIVAPPCEEKQSITTKQEHSKRANSAKAVFVCQKCPNAISARAAAVSPPGE